MLIYKKTADISGLGRVCWPVHYNIFIFKLRNLDMELLGMFTSCRKVREAHYENMLIHSLLLNMHTLWKTCHMVAFGMYPGCYQELLSIHWLVLGTHSDNHKYSTQIFLAHRAGKRSKAVECVLMTPPGSTVQCGAGLPQCKIPGISKCHFYYFSEFNQTSRKLMWKWDKVLLPNVQRDLYWGIHLTDFVTNDMKYIYNSVKWSEMCYRLLTCC